ncbi:UbiX family flavin prenyltransferase [Desulfuribacillus alkaliarsenatis]|uniref:Flavin prenyltransferase UbiX n=1 Tax=Desulfuribacillus alkaliarsenatis TaxID=766136 RepID=A0A1E5G6A2_9FIRM|nr:flavin prenyltransferase UbiX [Desulfuribacillus alkaliarsenatis]OEF98701.1 aromatic acid decarboxylase [Desulfuribacillus alkaliarsenatis]
MKKEIVVGITGASGSVYGIELVKQLQKLDCTTHLLVTSAGWQVILSELLEDNDSLEIHRKIDKNEQISILKRLGLDINDNVKLHSLNDFSVGIASGSYRFDAMVIVPCTMGTLSSIAMGASDNLLERVADTALKEGRKLIIVPRETPFNRIHLKNMLAVSEAGAIILPAMPAFYHKPQNINDIVSFLVGKILDQLHIEHQLFKRWGK